MYDWYDQPCPLCGDKPDRFVGTRGGASHRENLGVETEIWECSDCRIRFPNPMPYPKGGLGQHYDVGADEYFEVYDKDLKLRVADDLVARAELFAQKGRMLEIGVGRGEVLLAAKNRGWDVFGVEPSQTFADYAAERIDATIWREGLEEVDLPESHFDAVIFSAVLEHLYEPDRMMAKVVGSMRPGAAMYCDVPNEYGLYSRVGNLYQRIRGRKWCVNLAPTFSPFHVMGFSPRSFRAILKKHGLEVKVLTFWSDRGLVPSRAGIVGRAEALGAKIVNKISSTGERGTYMGAWAVKSM
jgi:SAM-dependent methyltransferase